MKTTSTQNTRRPKKVFITGANGFIGRALAQRYRSLGCEVCGIDLREDLGWGVIAADLMDPQSYQQTLAGCDLVIHTAALISNTAKMDDAWRINVLGTRTIINAAAITGVRRFVHLSSIAAFGFDHTRDVDESEPLRSINHPYVDTKIASEHAVLEAHSSGYLECTIIRPGDVYGPGSRPWVLMPLEMLKAGRFLLPAHGEGLFSPVYIDDLIDGILLAAGRDAGAGQIFVLTGTEQPSCNEYFGYLARMVGKHKIPSLSTGLSYLLTDIAGGAARLAGRQTELGRNTMWMLSRRAGYSIDKAQRLLGYQPIVRLDAGMARVNEWCQKEQLI